MHAALHFLHAHFPASWYAGLALLALLVAVIHLELRGRGTPPPPRPRS